jgi:NAD(P)-dependent dehydrogenase (short-subunit alcohol dehydrogenase family)
VQVSEANFNLERNNPMKRVFVTGASSGLGLATAKALVAHGYEVWGTSRDPNRIPHLPHLHAVRLDLSDRNSIHDAFNTALAEAGHFDVLINNAGAGHFGPAEFLSDKILAEQFQVLVFGHLQLMQSALQSMRPRGQGLIINVTSLASRLPLPFMAAYNAAKAAMAAFTMSFQLEIGHSGIHIVDLQPADIRTDFNQGMTKSSVSNPTYEQKMAKTWETSERNMREAPKPDLVAREILKLIARKNPPPRVTVGSTFQSKIAPLIFRFLPQRVSNWGLRSYYRI